MDEQMPSAKGLPLSCEERRRRLLQVVDGWRGRLAELEASAVVFFQDRDLDRISTLLVEKRRLESSLAAVESFVSRFLP